MTKSLELFLRQIVANQATMLLCEMDRGHCDGVQDICMQAIEASKKLVMTEGEKDGSH